jgi:hypothetical protein
MALVAARIGKEFWLLPWSEFEKRRTQKFGDRSGSHRVFVHHREPGSLVSHAFMSNDRVIAGDLSGIGC